MALLIVDDEESNRDMLSRRLQRQGFEVLLAEDGPQALATIGKQTPDMVLLDIRMPGMSGMEVLRAIRERHSPTQLPVIMVTAEGHSAKRHCRGAADGRQRLHHQAGGYAGGSGTYSHASIPEDPVRGTARKRGALRPCCAGSQ